LRVATSHVCMNSSMNLSDIYISPDPSFSRPQQRRWSRMSSLLADLRSHILAFIWWAISAQYVPPSVICMTFSRVHFALDRARSISFRSCCICRILKNIPYHTVWYIVWIYIQKSKDFFEIHTYTH
jgi:hypothetical protein